MLLYDGDAGADLDTDAPFHVERDQGLAHCGARHAKLLGKLALGGKTAAHRVLALVDELAQLIGDLAVESSRCKHFERQARALLRVSPETSLLSVVWSDHLSNALPVLSRRRCGGWDSAPRL